MSAPYRKDRAACRAPDTHAENGDNGGERRLSPFIRFCKSASFYAGTAAVFLLLNFFVVRLGLVNGQSMEPTLHENDVLLIWQFMYTPQPGDIVVTTDENELGRSLTKRVIATGGQRVQISDGRVYVNGSPLAEEYLPAGGWGGRPVDVTVPPNAVFLMGDNRNNSYDSRELGCLSRGSIMGAVVLRLYPFSKVMLF